MLATKLVFLAAVAAAAAATAPLYTETAGGLVVPVVGAGFNVVVDVGSQSSFRLGVRFGGTVNSPQVSGWRCWCGRGWGVVREIGQACGHSG